MSPDLSNKSYKKVDGELKNKKYPIEEIIEEKRITKLEEVVNTIKYKYSKYKIEVVAFGSYLNGTHYNDIDLAVIVYDDKIDKLMLQEISIEIQDYYINLGLDLDISVITSNDLSVESNAPFIVNIKKGKRLYISSTVKQSVFDITYEKIDYKSILNYYFNDLSKNYNEISTKIYVLKAYYFLYYVIASVLNKDDIVWYGENSISKEFYEISREDGMLQLIHKWFELLRKEKNRELVNDEIIYISKEKLQHDIVTIYHWIIDKYQ